MEMEIAVITDIHGNSSALNAGLSDIVKRSEVNDNYCCGDMISIGNETIQVVEKLRSRKDVSFVLGNHDEAILKILNGREPGSQGEVRAHHYWIARNMKSEFGTFLSKIPKKTQCKINNKRFLFVHYHLDEYDRFLSIDTSPSAIKLDNLYKSEDVDIVCFGHHHILHHFKGEHKIYLNPGSLGCNSKPVATYAIVRVKDDGCIDCSIKEVSYDNKEFLLGYFRYNVPAKESILQGFYGSQHKKLF